MTKIKGKNLKNYTIDGRVWWTIFKLSPSNFIYNDSILRDDLGIDSIGMMELDLLIEEEFDIVHIDIEFLELGTVQEVIDLVKKKLGT